MQIVDRKLLKVILSWAVGIILISYFFNYTQTIEELIEKSIVNSDNGLLILAAARQVFFSVLFSLPFLGGVYFLPSKALISGVFAATLLVMFITPSTDPVILLVTSLVGYALLKPLHEQTNGILAAYLVLLQLLLGFEWLNFISWHQIILSGLSDIAKDIKLAAEFTGGVSVLNFVSIFLWVSFTLSALFSARLFAYYNASIRNTEQRKKEEIALHEMRMRAEEARILQEMHALVHDLKTPLMTVQGLNSLVELASQDKKTLEYCKKIAIAVDNVNEMVSEILYDEIRKEISVADFINYVRAHAIVKFEGQKIRFTLAPDLPLISVNHIRMARVFSNIIQNAFSATAGMKDGLVEINVEQDQEKIAFTISDNGVGIAKEVLNDIWQIGYSTKNSSGLGLSFVKRVVENHSGTITIKSELGRGTIVEILIPEVNEK